MSSEHTGDFLLGWTAAGATTFPGKEPFSRRARIQKKEQGDCSCWASELDDRGSWFRAPGFLSFCSTLDRGFRYPIEFDFRDETHQSAYHVGLCASERHL